MIKTAANVFGVVFILEPLAMPSPCTYAWTDFFPALTLFPVRTDPFPLRSDAEKLRADLAGFVKAGP